MIITKYFTPKRSFQRLAKIKTPLGAVSRIEGVWVKLWGFFSPFWLILGSRGLLGRPTRWCVCSQQVNKLERRNVWLNRDRFSCRNGLLIYSCGIFWQPVAGGKKDFIYNVALRGQITFPSIVTELSYYKKRSLSKRNSTGAPQWAGRGG